MKTIVTEDIGRPLYRDLSSQYAWPLPKRTASGVLDSRGITPIYRSVKLHVPYDERHAATYLMLQVNSADVIPSNTLRIYGWRDPQPASLFKSSVQYRRFQGMDYIDLEPIKLGEGGAESIFALSVGHQWRWIQLVCLWPASSISIFLMPEPLTNVIYPDNPFIESPPLDDVIGDDFEDEVPVDSVIEDNFEVEA